LLFRRIGCIFIYVETAASLNNSGIALTEANRPDEAISLFRRALIMEPGNPLLWLNLGIAQQHRGDYDKALDSFQHALFIDEDLDEAWFSMGLIYFEMEQLDLAEDCYHSALALNDASPKIWNNLGVLYFTGGNYEEARHCFEEAVALIPLYEEALFNLRDVCRELKDYRAAAEFERTLSGLNSGRGQYRTR
jgi:tetratricopeptide (TPR) repeat protein